MQVSGYRLFSILFTCSSAIALGLPARVLAAETAKNVYPAEVTKNFMKGCQFKSKKEYCSCVLNSLQAKYTFAEFRKVDEEARTTRKVPDAVQLIFDSCKGKK
jgi:hypothetical protein